MGRQHLAMGVDIDPFAFSLLEQFFKIQQIMTGHEDRLPLQGLYPDFCRHRISKPARVCPVKDLHGLQVDLSCAHGEIHQVIERWLFVSEKIEGFVGKGIHRLIFHTQHMGMIAIGSKPLQSIRNELLEPCHIVAHAVQA